MQQTSAAAASRLPLPLLSDLAVSGSYKPLQELTKHKVFGDAGRVHQGALGRSPREGSAHIPVPSGAQPSWVHSPQTALGLGWRDPTEANLHHHVRPSPLPRLESVLRAACPPSPAAPSELPSLQGSHHRNHQCQGDPNCPFSHPRSLHSRQPSPPWLQPGWRAAGHVLLIGWERHRYSQAPS